MCTTPSGLCCFRVNPQIVAVHAACVLQDLQLILSLVATLLRNQPQLADVLLAVTIDYNNGQKLDWVDIIIAALNVLPGLAGRAAEQLHSRATYTPSFAAASSKPGSVSDGSGVGSFAWVVLNSIADCLSATAAAAACQPSRVLTALCSCQLLEGVVAAAEPLPLVAIEELGGWVQQHQTLSGSEEDWSTLGTLQVRGPCVGSPAVCSLHAACAASAVLAVALHNARPVEDIERSARHYQFHRQCFAQTSVTMQHGTDRGCHGLRLG
jgi:hypothetical protein